MTSATSRPALITAFESEGDLSYWTLQPCRAAERFCHQDFGRRSSLRDNNLVHKTSAAYCSLEETSMMKNRWHHVRHQLLSQQESNVVNVLQRASVWESRSTGVGRFHRLAQMTIVHCDADVEREGPNLGSGMLRQEAALLPGAVGRS